MADSDALQYRRAGLQVHGTVAASHAGTHARTGDTQSVCLEHPAMPMSCINYQVSHVIQLSRKG